MRNNCKLLPHITENINFTNHSQQIFGWEIEKLNIKNEWQYSHGENVVVAVLDTGCDLNHDDLKSNILDGKNFINDSYPDDDNGHGTHVCGSIAACNNGVGIVGVAPQAKILPVKVLDSNGRGNNDIIAKAIAWSVDYGCDLITMSLGSEQNSLSISKALDYAHKKDCVIFCAAGNSGQYKDIMYPARYDNVIAIGSVDSNFNRSKFTCSGDSLDFLSPGENIYGCTINNSYISMSGTSMANPFAVGCAALVCSYAKKNNYPKLSMEEYINIFKQNSLSLKDQQFSGKKRYEGYGIIQPSCKILKI